MSLIGVSDLFFQLSLFEIFRILVFLVGATGITWKIIFLDIYNVQKSS